MRVKLTINFSKPPETQALEGEIEVAKFSLVTTERCKVKAENVQPEVEQSIGRAVWPSSIVERFIVLDKPDGAVTDKAAINASLNK